MGIYDRDYYRNEGPSIFDALIPSGVVCRWLISINVAVFILQWLARHAAMTHPDGLIIRNDGWVNEWFILDTDAVLHGQVWRLLTYAFLHDFAFSHIFFNMLFLWWFGSDVEQLYGHKEFLAIYIVSALLGGCAYELWDVLRGEHSRCLGASGAVTTMLVLCAFHFPHRIIYIFMLLPVPIWFLAIFNVAKDAYVFLSQERTGVAVIVHLAGAVFAVAYYKMQLHLMGWFRSLMWWKHVRSRPRLKIFEPALEKQEPVAVSAMGSAPIVMDEHLEAKLDALLEKIARTGKESLTEQERQILKQASEMYKRRRN